MCHEHTEDFKVFVYIYLYICINKKNWNRFSTGKTDLTVPPIIANFTESNRKLKTQNLLAHVVPTIIVGIVINLWFQEETLYEVYNYTEEKTFQHRTQCRTVLLGNTFIFVLLLTYLFICFCFCLFSSFWELLTGLSMHVICT